MGRLSKLNLIGFLLLAMTYIVTFGSGFYVFVEWILPCFKIILAADSTFVIFTTIVKMFIIAGVASIIISAVIIVISFITAKIGFKY